MILRKFILTAFFISNNLFFTDGLHTFNKTDLDKVIYSSIIFRHGDRTPVKPYPNDPYNNLSYWPTGWGQLTNIGKKQHYSLGKWLRNRYTYLIGDYILDDIYIRSTDVDRTLMSALSNLAGMFPPSESHVWNPDLVDWQPIPVHTVPEKEDNILAGKKSCPKYDYEFNLLQQTPQFIKIYEENKELFQYLSEKSGTKIDSLTNLEYLYNTLFIEKTYNLTLPDWTIGYYPDKLISLAGISFTMQCHNSKLQRLKIGLLFNEIIQHMEEKISGMLKPNRKLWIYSAHDTTISNILMTLGVFVPHNPPYTSCVLIELKKNTEAEYGVMITYRRNESSIELLKLPNCETFCKFSKFKEILKPILIKSEEWENECQLNILSRLAVKTQFGATAIIAAITGSFLIILLLASLTIALICYRNRDNESNKLYLRLEGDEN